MITNETELTAPQAPLSNAALAPLWAILIWSGNTIVTKAAAVVIEPASIAFYRWLTAFLVLTPFAGPAVWRQRAILVQHWPKLALLGALGMATYQGLAYEAARTTSAVNMGVIQAMIPLLSALLAKGLSPEADSGRLIAGAIVSSIGLVVLTAQGHPFALLDGGVHRGDVWMLIAVSANSLYGVLLKRWTLPLTAWQQLHMQIGFGLLILTPFWIAGPISPITRANAPLILYAAIPASIGAPFFWMKAIKTLGASRAALFMNAIPLLVALAAWAALGEQLHVYHAVGGFIALLGVVWGLRQRFERA
jgi:drug/metabolite transporter (DMT)-like permease